MVLPLARAAAVSTRLRVRGVARMGVGQVTATEHLLLTVGNVEDHVAHPGGGHKTPDHPGSLRSGCGLRRRGGLPIRCGLRRLPLRHARRLIHVVDRLARLIEAPAPSGWQILPLIVLCNEPTAPRCSRRLRCSPRRWRSQRRCQR